MAKIALWTLPALALAALVAFLLQLDRAEMPGTLASFADIPIVTPEGKEMPLAARLKPGVPTVIGFWDENCGPCITEAGLLADLRARFGPDDLNIAYLYVDAPPFDPAQGRRFLARAGAEALAWGFVAPEPFLALSRQSMIALPRTYTFAADGTPTHVFTGYASGLSPMMEEDAIAGLLMEAP
ncbi:MAG: hypothetical protein AAGD40_10570 [Pseudomonadota bacterium]